LAKVENPFVLAKRSPVDSGDHRFEPKVFNEWLEQVPVGDPVHAAKALYERLRQMNGIDIPVSIRLQDLESCVPHITSVIDLLEHQVAGQAYPLSRRMQMLVGMISAIYSLTAKAYKVVLDQYAHDSIAGTLLHKQNRVLALHRTIYMLGRIQLHAYEHYQPLPAFLWHEIHFIHQYGWTQKLTSQSISVAGKQVIGATTASALYKQALLLELAGPYRLLQGEVEQVYLALINRVNKCRLLELGKEESDDALFIVDFALDSGARHRNPEQDEGVGKGWLLDTSELSLILANELDLSQMELGAVRPHDVSDVLPTELLAKVMLAWGIGQNRRSDRSDKLSKMVMLNGLEPLYSKFGGAPVPSHAEYWVEDELPQIKEDEVSTFEGHLAPDEHWVEGGPDLSRLKRWEDEQDPSAKPVTEDEITETLKESAEENELESETDEPLASVFVVLDESANGYHLSTTGTQVDKLKVGELVGLSEVLSEDGDEEIKLGVIRWLKMETPSLLDFGVELLVGDWQPVVFCLEGSQGGREYYRALYLRQANADELLITEPFYSEGFCNGLLLTEETEISIQLSSILEATASFLQFRIIRPDAVATDDFSPMDVDGFYME